MRIQARASGPRVPGVDDFALRRGHVYSTALIGIETRRPVDMLPERSADSLESWLGSRPAIKVICRDRGSCYAEGAARAAPLAVQAADRWHLLHNLAETVERPIARHRSCLRDEAAQPEAAPAIPVLPTVPEGQHAPTTRDRHAAIRATAARGLTITQISRELQARPPRTRLTTARSAPRTVRSTRWPGSPRATTTPRKYASAR